MSESNDYWRYLRNFGRSVMVGIPVALGAVFVGDHVRARRQGVRRNYKLRTLPDMEWQEYKRLNRNREVPIDMIDTSRHRQYIQGTYDELP